MLHGASYLVGQEKEILISLVPSQPPWCTIKSYFKLLTQIEQLELGEGHC